MWIRSQDKKILIKVNCVFITNDTLRNHWRRTLYHEENPVLDYVIQTDMTLLGTYSTEEKAMKVLDMIQMCITGEMAFNREYFKKFRDIGMGTYSAREFVQEMQRQVFQMPQDDEVSDK